MNTWILLIIAAAVVLCVVGVCKRMPGNTVNIRGQQLNTYNHSSGGGMNGGYYDETVKRYEDQALITIESTEWYLQDPTVTEYLADAAVLDELEAVVRKYKMDSWDGKEFTKEIVYDGETESYRFHFDDESISFSSQIYPAKYWKKLAELDRVLEKYIEAGEKLPGLVNPKTGEEEHDILTEDELVIYVYSYAKDSLGLRILNGTDEEIEIPETYKLINTDTGAVLFDEETPYGGRFSEHSRDEMNIRLEERLPAGHYQLIFGGVEIPFEIAKP